MNKKQIVAVFWGVLAVTALIFSDLKIGISPIIFYPPEILVYLCFGWMLLSVNRRERLYDSFKLLSDEIKLAIGLIFLGGLIGTIISPIFPSSLGAFKTWIVTPLLFLWLLLSLQNISSTTVKKIIIGFGVVISIYGLVIFFFSHQNRLTSIFSSPNYFGAAISPILALVLIERFNTKDKRLIPIILLLAIALVLSFSIGALIGLLLSLGIYLLLNNKLRLKAALLFLALLVVIILLSISRLLPERNSFESRTQIWRTGGELALLSPVAGIGLRGFSVAYPKYVGRYFADPIDMSAPQPHNLFLSFWLNVGLSGLLGFVYLLWQVLTKYRISAAHFAIIAILGHGLIDTPYWRLDLILLFWTYIWLIIGCDNEKA